METKKTEPKKEVSTKTNKEILLIAPKVVTFTAFRFLGMQSIPALIGFTGKLPVVNADMSLSIKKLKLKAGDILVRDSYGDIVNVIDEEKLSMYDVKQELDYTEKFKVELKVKPVKERKQRIPKK